MEATDQSRHDGRESSNNVSWNSAIEGLKDAGRQTTQDFKRQAGEFAEAQKNAGAEQIDAAARAVHGAAQRIEGDYPRAASYVHEAADRIGRASSNLRDRSVDDLLGSFTHFVREQPALAFGGALIVSVALTRFLKSSSERNYPAGPQSDTGSALSDIEARTDETARAAYAVGESAEEGTGDRFLRFCKERPLFLVGAGIVMGAIFGSSIPPTQTEDQAMGETSDRLKDRIQEIASEQYEAAADTAANLYQDAQQKADSSETREWREGSDALRSKEHTEASPVPAPVMTETALFDRQAAVPPAGP